MSERTNLGHTKTETSFSTLLAALNEAQRRAVEHIDGVVMVLAGPGTGKTQLLAMRVANILKETQLDPQNILCLTFTDSAVSALRRRLATIIGPAAVSVRVHTFHSFCNEVIQAWPDVFSFARELEAITAVERAELLETLIDQRPANSPLKPFGNPHLYIGALGQTIAQLKQEHVAPETVAAVGHELATFCEVVTEQVDLFASKKAAERTDADCTEVHEYLRAAITSHQHLAGYQAALNEAAEQFKFAADSAEGKRAAGAARTAYKNTIRKLLRSWTSIAPRYVELAHVYEQYGAALLQRGQYDFEDMILLVLEELEKNDELLAHYQEAFQYVLVDEYQDTNGAQHELLFRLVEFSDEPNLFVVGDDKQAIFRFQGASVENILSFYERYRETVTVISLADNYRSYQEILDSAAAVVGHNTVQLHEHIPQSTDALVATRGVKPGSIQVVSYATDTLEKHGVARSIKELGEQGVAWREVAVLCRTNQEAEDVLQVLRSYDVSAELKGNKNALQSEAGRHLVTLLQFAAGEAHAETLWRLVHVPSFGLDPLTLARAAAVAYQEKESLFETLLRDEHTQRVLEKGARWQAQATDEPLATLVAEVLSDARLVEYYTESKPDPEQLSALQALYREAQQLGLRSPEARVADFLQHLALLAKHHLTLHASTVTSQDAVQVMTAHRAKGLEFDHVFVFGVVNTAWGNRRVRNMLPLPLGLIQVQSHADSDIEDERRLFYVALTRAKNALTVTHAQATANGRALEPAQFVHELPAAVPRRQADVSVSLEDETRAPSTLGSLAPYIAELLPGYRLSVTHLNNYLECPRLFLYRNLIHAPARKTKHMAFGTAVHAALFDLLSRRSAGKSISAAHLVERFEHHVNNERLPAVEQREVMEQGRAVLKKYYDQYQESFSPNVLLEYSFAGHGVMVGGVELTGMLDKIEIAEPQLQEVVVVDYKTGIPDNKRSALTEDGEYFRQLVFYKLLCDGSKRFQYQMTSGVIDFVQPAKNGSFVKHTVTITDQHTAALVKTIETAWQQISSLAFLEAPGCGSCEYCLGSLSPKNAS